MSGKVSKIFDVARNEGRKHLLEPEAKAVCMEYGIPVPAFKVVTNVRGAIKFAEKIGYPTVLKIVSPDVIHKTDVGGVALNLENPREIRDAYNRIITNVEGSSPKSRITGILVQKMAPSSTEIIIGAIKDPQFGQSLMFGLGGIFVEILRDVTFRIAPISEQEASDMITEVKAFPILKGYRGQPPADIDAIVKTLLNTSKLVMDYPEIKELDLNPIMVYENGIKTIDARIVLED